MVESAAAKVGLKQAGDIYDKVATKADLPSGNNGSVVSDVEVVDAPRTAANDAYGNESNVVELSNRNSNQNVDAAGVEQKATGTDGASGNTIVASHGSGSGSGVGGRGSVNTNVDRSTDSNVSTGSATAKLGERPKTSAPSKNTNHADSKVTWVDENASMSDRARNYDDSATGSRSNIETQKGQAPSIQRALPDGKTRPVKFDGLDSDVLIDRKISVVTTRKSKNQVIRQSQALKENGLTGRWEVPNEAQARRAQKMFDELGVDNIDVKIVSEQ